MLAGEAIVVVIDVARAEAAGVDPQRLAAGRVKPVGRASPERIDELRLPAIGVVNEAVAVAVGIHEGHKPAGRVKDLGRPEAIGVEQARDPAGRVIDRGRDVLLASWTRIGRLAASNVVVVRLSSGSTLATGLSKLVEHSRRDEAKRVGRPDRIVRQVIGESWCGSAGDRCWPTRRLSLSNTLVVIKPSGFMSECGFQVASYAKLVRFPRASICATGGWPGRIRWC